MKKTSLPTYLAITGQSGCGKGSIIDALTRQCNEAGIPVLRISTGDLIRSTIQKRSHIIEQMVSVNNKGLRQPPIIAASLWMNEIINKHTVGGHIIHEGSPRSVDEFMMMHSLVEAGYIDSFKVLEVQAPNSICEKRLYERTKRDKREDLSVDDRPGEPDLAKIKTKLDWWDDNCSQIMHAAKETGCHALIDNTRSLEEVVSELYSRFNLVMDKV